MRQTEIVEQLQQRTQKRLGERRLVVDYYRIRRRIAFPWPMTQIPQPHFQVPTIDSYPWHTWMSWVVEERINAIGWAADLSGDEALRQRSTEEIAGLARWPSHASGAPLDLCFGHLMRTLVMAKRNWSWLNAQAQADIVAACRRALDQRKTWMDENLPQFQSVAEILAAKDPDYLTRNIPLINATALTLAAQEAQHPATAALQNRVVIFLLARLEILKFGSSENVAYDGYVLDFIADLLPQLPVKQRQSILDHPALRQTLAMGPQLAAPGDVLNVANLGDTEPKEMTFHASAHAKFAHIMPLPQSAWYLAHARLDWLRSDALAAMHSLAEQPAEAPTDDIAVGPYAVTLRTGWNADDTAVAIGASRGGLGHLHSDGGSIMIARGGHWLLADPGYQQYLQTREREFTLGKHAHNAPVINGIFQTAHATKIIATQKESTGLRHALLDLTANYAPEAGVRFARRAIYLLPSGVVVVADHIEGATQLEYAWHGLPDASWWADPEAENRAVIHHQGAELWITSSGGKITQQQITRLKGSRGHESLVANIAARPEKAILWWIFNIGPEPAPWQTRGDSLALGEFTLQSP